MGAAAEAPPQIGERAWMRDDILAEARARGAAGPQPPEAPPGPPAAPPPKDRQSVWHFVAVAFSVALIAFAIYVLAHTLTSVNYAELRAAIQATSSRQIGLALLASAFSYLALTGYDAIALRQMRLKVRYRTTALASFTSYAISFTLGFPLITGGTVRYWIYSRAGLSAGKVASLTLVAGITFWLGMALVLALALTLEPSAISDINHFDWRFNLGLGILGLAALAGYLAFVATARRRVTFQKFSFELPGLWLTLGQVALGVADLAGAGAALYLLLPSGFSIDFGLFLALYVLACLLGIASNAPGGLGVFEVTMLKVVGAPQEAMLASLLLFRLVYYLFPFVLALALLGANESVRRWNFLREAMTERADDEE